MEPLVLWNPRILPGAAASLLIGAVLGAFHDQRIALLRQQAQLKADQLVIEEGQNRLELVGRATDDVLWEWDLRNNNLWFGEGLLPSFGYDPKTSKFDVALWLEKIHPDDRAKVEEGIREMVEGRQDRWSGEYRMLKRNGDWADVLDRAWVIKDAKGEPARLTGAKMNVTFVRQAATQANEIQRLEASNKFRRDFLSAAAHDIATPLTPLRLQLHVLEAADPATPLGSVGKNVQILKRNVERLAHFVDELLEAARLESNRIELHMAPVNLGSLAEHVLDGFRPVAAQKNIEIRASGIPVAVKADEERLARVVTNLVSNAIKFTPPGGEVRLTWGSSGPGAYLIVADTGVGMRPQEAGRLFQPFSRLENSEGSGGSGLGLYISKSIVQVHGGRLTVNSPGPGKGSTFSVFLPSLADAPAAPPAPALLPPLTH